MYAGILGYSHIRQAIALTSTSIPLLESNTLHGVSKGTFLNLDDSFCKNVRLSFFSLQLSSSRFDSKFLHC